jgi:hypothetical protein
MVADESGGAGNQQAQDDGKRKKLHHRSNRITLDTGSQSPNARRQKCERPGAPIRRSCRGCWPRIGRARGGALTAMRRSLRLPQAVESARSRRMVRSRAHLSKRAPQAADAAFRVLTGDVRSPPLCRQRFTEISVQATLKAPRRSPAIAFLRGVLIALRRGSNEAIS